MASIEQFIQRKDNMTAILNALRHAPSTRRQLCSSLHLSWGCVSELVTLLIGEGIVLEKKSLDGTEVGRTPLRLFLNNDVHFLGIDVNRMGIKSCVCSITGEILSQKHYPIRYDDAATLAASVRDAVRDKIAETACFYGIGVAMQGTHDKTTNEWLFPGNDKDFSVEIEKMLKNEFCLPVLVEHDPNCILFGFLEELSEEAVLMIRIDDSIGMAARLQGKFFDCGALEIAHTVVCPGGEVCSCGHRGCLECYVGMSGIEKLSGIPFSRLVNEEQFSAERSLRFNSAGDILGISVGNVCNLIHFDRVILCGEMVKYSSLFEKSFEKSFRNTVLKSQQPDITLSDITDAASGAARLAAFRYPYKI